MQQLENIIGYKFQDIENLKRALTHSSYVREHDMPREMCNEKLEFLGDAVIETAICDYIFREFTGADEGGLSKIKAALVRCESLASAARRINLGDYLRLGNGEVMAKSYEKDNILENAFEALIGAIFFESGYETASEKVIELLDDSIKKAKEGKLIADYKSELQERVQMDGVNHKIEYVVTRESGKSHDKTFEVELYVDGTVMGKGIGKSKKNAETMAAKEAILKMERK